jgi:tungstate transport system substrate-binding protein
VAIVIALLMSSVFVVILMIICPLVPPKRGQKMFRVIFFCFISLLVGFTADAIAQERLRLATTTSTDSSGLLAVLLPPFEVEHGCVVDIIAVGTGKALKLGETGDVDVVLVHAREKEDAFVATGFGVKRRDVMYNDFVLLGPKENPAEIPDKLDIASAMELIAGSQSIFVSRGDDSGTHSRERQLWQAAEISPDGEWYLEAGRGMAEVLIMADERRAYTLSDRGTYLAFKNKLELKVILSGDPRLFNPYGVILVNPERHPHTAYRLGESFVEYLVSPEARKIIQSFRKNGEQLFYVIQ